MNQNPTAHHAIAQTQISNKFYTITWMFPCISELTDLTLNRMFFMLDLDTADNERCPHNMRQIPDPTSSIANLVCITEISLSDEVQIR